MQSMITQPSPYVWKCIFVADTDCTKLCNLTAAPRASGERMCSLASCHQWFVTGTACHGPCLLFTLPLSLPHSVRI